MDCYLNVREAHENINMSHDYKLTVQQADGDELIQGDARLIQRSTCEGGHMHIDYSHLEDIHVFPRV